MAPEYHYLYLRQAFLLNWSLRIVEKLRLLLRNTKIPKQILYDTNSINTYYISAFL